MFNSFDPNEKGAGTLAEKGPPNDGTAASVRETLFISKATPGDDEFVLWLAPKLEAAGYRVFADIRVLEGGDKWRREITDALQNTAVKMLLCCSDATLAREGVVEEIEIATDLAKSLRDPKFIIPLRLAEFKKLFGIGQLQHIDFVRGWGAGLEKLLKTLKARQIPCDPDRIEISPNWEAYRLRKSIKLVQAPERLTSNWLRIAEGVERESRITSFTMHRQFRGLRGGREGWPLTLA